LGMRQNPNETTQGAWLILSSARKLKTSQAGTTSDSRIQVGRGGPGKAGTWASAKARDEGASRILTSVRKHQTSPTNITLNPKILAGRGVREVVDMGKRRTAPRVHVPQNQSPQRALHRVPQLRLAPSLANTHGRLCPAGHELQLRREGQRVRPPRGSVRFSALAVLSMGVASPLAFLLPPTCAPLCHETAEDLVARPAQADLRPHGLAPSDEEARRRPHRSFVRYPSAAQQNAPALQQKRMEKRKKWKKKTGNKKSTRIAAARLLECLANSPRVLLRLEDLAGVLFPANSPRCVSPSPSPAPSPSLAWSDRPA
jgi:hypothetical protein